MQNNDKKSRVIIRAIAFVIVFFLIFSFIEAFTYDHTKAFDGWAYIYDTDIDVLIMGSSQAASFDAAYISEQTDTNTVILSSGAQSIKQVYFNLKEALKYQSPDLVIVEEFSIIEDTLLWMKEEGLYGLALANLDGMKMSPLKLQAAFSTLSFDGYGVFHTMRESGKTERFIFAAKHLKLQLQRLFYPKERILQPLKGTILHNPDTFATLEQYEDSLAREIDESFILPSENVVYMEKVIKLCIENNVELELIKTPMIKNASSISGHYAIEKFLDNNNYNINAYNLMDKKYNLDCTFEDFSDINHVSESGMRKISDWLASHINEKFNN